MEQAKETFTEDELESLVEELRTSLQAVRDKRTSVTETIASLESQDSELLVQQQLIENKLNNVLVAQEEEKLRLAEAEHTEDSDSSSTMETSEDDTDNGEVIQEDEETTEQGEQDQDQESVFPCPQFLNPKDDDKQKKFPVALASYPRCGNSLLRSLLEKMTGVVTGTDSKPDRRLIKQLTAMGFRGEGVVDDSVLFVKTHYPERLGHCMFTARKAIILVRNPFDCIVSYFNMVLTQTHTQTILDSEYKKYADIWDMFVCEEIQVWKQFYDHWLNKRVENRIPTLVVRYEDLVQHRKASLYRIANFVYDNDTLKENVIENIEKICAISHHESGVYKPRSMSATQNQNGDCIVSGDVSEESGEKIIMGDLTKGKSGFLKSLKFYNKHQIQYVLSTARSRMHELGYYLPFEELWGPGYITRPVTSCLVFEKLEDTGADEEMYELKLNSRVGIRPRTADDPWGRGFGKRWKARLAALPPVRMNDNTCLDFRDIHG